MKDDVLDYFQDRGASGQKIIAIKYFYFESKARLYAARLEEEGIPSFVSNTNSITAFPLGDAGIGLHIRQSDQKAAAAIIREMDRLASRETIENESFREADHDEIDYQRQLNQQKKSGNKAVRYFIGFLFLLVVLRIIWRAFHRGNAWDLF